MLRKIILRAVIGIGLYASADSAQISVANVAENYDSITTGGGTTNTIPGFTIAAGKDRKLVVVVGWESGGITRRLAPAVAICVDRQDTQNRRSRPCKRAPFPVNDFAVHDFVNILPLQARLQAGLGGTGLGRSKIVAINS